MPKEGWRIVFRVGVGCAGSGAGLALTGDVLTGDEAFSSESPRARLGEAFGRLRAGVGRSGHISAHTNTTTVFYEGHCNRTPLPIIHSIQPDILALLR